MATNLNGFPLKFIISMIFSALLLLLLFGFGVWCHSVPGIYVFGDSTVDAGNNNYLPLSLLRADYPPYGVDFPTGKATGRYSNGKTPADFLADMVRLPMAPSYLSLMSNGKKLDSTNATVTGVNFASAGAGILDGTFNFLIQQTIPLNQQIRYYSLVHEQLIQKLGSVAARTHLAMSLFLIVFGANDFSAYFNASNHTRVYTPQQYVHLMAISLKQSLKMMYELGARKFVFIGLWMIGCCPKVRTQTTTNSCMNEINYWSKTYNDGLKILLKELKLESPDINYSFFDAYHATSTIMQDPNTYGITEIKEACCGFGNLKADIHCLPNFEYCFNRRNHFFWDAWHPTELVYHMFADLMYNGSQRFTIPISVQQLIDM